ncbi:hypothetical protein [Reinekea blandensis]|uniref:Uncharacterized protein n=1 Tax=Reinekea blandensis MED297 TaxID=314283 RepID=A4BEH2_9GAMM|nr:hypothetical protein [Reinekea blandensis]EAR09399.1 hypothetical protein MED297_02227 [Reinekea sp. MED297] [Reinekea blandensis MED297]
MNFILISKIVQRSEKAVAEPQTLVNYKMAMSVLALVAERDIKKTTTRKMDKL